MNVFAKQTRTILQGQRYSMKILPRRSIVGITAFNKDKRILVKLRTQTPSSMQEKWISHRFCHSGLMTPLEYDRIVNNTLEDLADHFDYLADEGYFNDQFDLTLADGVLTINVGDAGTYVINKQTPNRQIWLSSPQSGPKRYDFKDNAWVYSHEEDRTLHQLLSDELSEMLGQDVDFSQLSHAKCNT